MLASDQAESNRDAADGKPELSVTNGHRDNTSSSKPTLTSSSVMPTKIIDDHRSTVSGVSRSSTGMAKRLSSMLSSRGLRASSGGGQKVGRASSNISQQGDSLSISAISDNGTSYSLEGQQSVAVTIDSHDTVKASNRHIKKVPETSVPPSPSASPATPKKKSKGWQKKLKRLVGGKPGHSKSCDEASIKSATPPSMKRGVSLDQTTISKKDETSSSSVVELGSHSARNTSRLDLAIRGRLDGMDILSLGPARRASLPPLAAVGKGIPKAVTTNKIKTDAKSGSDPSKNLDPLTISFTGLPTSQTAAEIVSDMLWASAGREQPEIILEGYIPGGGDRWVVRMEDVYQQRVTLTGEASSSANIVANKVTTSEEGRTSPSLPTVLSTDDDESTAVTTEDGSPRLPMYRLWDKIWGDQPPPPMPTHMQTGADDDDNSESQDEILNLAAACSVPVDLDDDTFMISSPEHLRSVHDLVMIPLQRRRFDSALNILTKLLRGLEASNELEHLVGATRHNIGMINLCQGNFGSALENFKKAVSIRTECLPPNHPDVAVSLMRQGTAYFALESYDEAIYSFTVALGMSPAEDATRSKIINNLGAVHFQKQEYSEALKSFTKALEIQREWLDGPVRREPIVYDAATTLGNIGKVYLRKEDYDLAYYVYEEACLLLTTTFRKDHKIVLTSQSNMAIVDTKNGNIKKAILTFQSVLQSQQKCFGEDSQETMETYGIMAYLLIKQVDFDEALKYLRIVESWQSERLSPTHPSRGMIVDTIKALEKCVEGKASVWV